MLGVGASHHEIGRVLKFIKENKVRTNHRQAEKLGVELLPRAPVPAGDGIVAWVRGKALFQMMGVFAEFERAIMRDRIKAGLARARAQGKRLGCPPVSPEVEQAIRDARAEGKGMLKIARELGVGTATVQRVLRF